MCGICQFSTRWLNPEIHALAAFEVTWVQELTARIRSSIFYFLVMGGIYPMFSIFALCLWCISMEIRVYPLLLKPYDDV